MMADRRTIVLSYATEAAGQTVTFSERIVLPSPIPRAVPPRLLRIILESVHLAIGVSYYKASCPGKIVHPYHLTQAQAAYWTDLYHHGLGELCYRNAINISALAAFPVTTTRSPQPVVWPRARRALVGIGGGKDSIVVAEELRRMGWDFSTFSVGNGRHTIIDEVMKVVGRPRLHLVRQLDKKVLEPPPSWITGHVPVSAIFAWLGVLCAAVYDYQYFLVGNEASSDSGNVRWRGHEINHQWSKSTAFEVATRSYLRSWVTSDVDYASPLRSFSELRVIQLFTEYKKYWHVFSSCNRQYVQQKRSTSTRWCGACPKCAFVFLGLAAFLPLSKAVRIIGRNMLDAEEMIPLYQELLGFTAVKPFECVGTFEETRVAFSRLAAAHPRLAVIRALAGRVRRQHIDERSTLRAKPAASTPPPFILLGMREIVIVGYAVEGRATHAWLRRNYPWIHLAIVDRRDGPKYLAQLDRYDLAVKTAGMRDIIPIGYTTATNLFFGHVTQQVVGVTGTKGKSTTASLIAHILKTAGQPTALLGNIGSPMLAWLDRYHRPRTVVVLELSSFQLAELRTSPQIAVWLNVFPEHLDVHGSLQAYIEAKRHICAFQRPQDTFVYNPRDRHVRGARSRTNGQAIPFPHTSPVALEKTQLRGDHFLDAIGAASTVGRLLGVNKQAIERALRTFQPLPHRLQVIGTVAGVQYVDDAISTTPQSTIAALAAFPQTATLFLGGTDRGYDFRELERAIHRSRVQQVVLFPDTGKRMLKQTSGLRVLHTRSMRQAVAFAARYAQPGTTCLLSCASPSYSLWKNFEVKGDEFQQCVKALCP